jgi:hypothetical protein
MVNGVTVSAAVEGIVDTTLCSSCQPRNGLT